MWFSHVTVKPGTIYTAVGCRPGLTRDARRMPGHCNRLVVCGGFSFLVFLTGCGAKTECDSIETRNAVLRFISEDRNNPLIDYAARNSNSQSRQDVKPLYQLGQRLVAAEKTKDKSTLKCSGGLSVSVGDFKATKEVNFTVQQLPDGKMSVSVEPFQF